MAIKLTERQYYSLWRQYLLRSQAYQEYVEWYKSALKPKSARNIQKTPLPKKIQKITQKHGIFQRKAWIRNVKLFAYCDARKLPIDTYIRYKSRFWQPGASAVQPLSEYLNRDLIPMFAELVKENECEDTWADFLDFQTQWNDQLDVYVIRFRGNSSHEIKKAVDALLKKHRLRYEKKRTRNHIDKLKIYLQAYDLHVVKGLKYPDVIKKMQPDQDQHDDPDVQRRYRKWIKQAKELIRGAELGYFPPMPAWTLKFLEGK